MSRARRVELRVVAIGGTLPQNLTDRLLSATYTDNEEDAADDLQKIGRASCRERV